MQSYVTYQRVAAPLGKAEWEIFRLQQSKKSLSTKRLQCFQMHIFRVIYITQQCPHQFQAELFKDMAKIAIVREPFVRLVSAYRWVSCNNLLGYLPGYFWGCVIFYFKGTKSSRQIIFIGETKIQKITQKFREKVEKSQMVPLLRNLLTSDTLPKKAETGLVYLMLMSTLYHLVIGIFIRH